MSVVMRMKNLLRRPPAWTQDDCYRPLHHMCSLMPNRNRNENWNKDLQDLWDLQTPIVCFERVDGWQTFLQQFFSRLCQNAGYAWDWGQPILDQMQICAKDFSSIERKKEASMIWGNSLWTKFRQRNRCLSNLTLQGVASVNSIGFFFFFNSTGSFQHF